MKEIDKFVDLLSMPDIQEELEKETRVLEYVKGYKNLQHILTELEEWLKKESNKTFLNVISMAVYMKVLDKIQELKEKYK